MTDTRIAKLMWDAYAIQAGWDSFDGKPLPAWDELSEDRQSCWVAAASVTADRIEKLEAALQAVIRYAGNAGDDYLADKARKALEGKENE